MEKIDIVLAVMGIGFFVTIFFLRMIWNQMWEIDLKINDLDRRLSVLEGITMVSRTCSNEINNR